MAASDTGAQASGRYIDVHHHISPPFFAEAVGRENLVNTYAASRVMAAWTPAVSLAEMDRDGTATVITTINSLPRLIELPDATSMVRRCNEYSATLARDYPGRFGMFAALPMRDVDASLKEIEYALDVLEADGVYLSTHLDKMWLGDPYFAPLFEELNRRGALLYTHPTVPEFAARLIPDVPDTVTEITHDTTRAIASFVFSGTASRYPNVNVIWSHGGGTMPSIIDRFIELAEREHIAARLPHGVMHEIRRFYYDTAQVADPVPMAAMTTLLPLSQIVFGTDFPFRSAKVIADGLVRCGFDAADLRSIHRDNILKLIPRFA